MEKIYLTLTSVFKRSKSTIFGTSLGVGLMILLYQLYRQRRNHRKALANAECNGRIPLTYTSYSSLKQNGPVLKKRTLSPIRHSKSNLTNNTSHRSSLSNISDITITEIGDLHTGDPQHLCDIGLNSLQKAIECWEDAMSSLTQMDESAINESKDHTDLLSQLQKLLEMSYHMQDEHERRCERYMDHFALDSTMAAIADMGTFNDSRRAKSTTGTEISSDQDSFVSAVDLADISDLETHRELFQHLRVYEAGLLELKHGMIPCRVLRTDITGCLSDTEFLAKLHCIRFASEMLMQKRDTQKWFIDSIRFILTRILIKSNKEASEFNVAYDSFIDYVTSSANHSQMQEELKARGVKCMSLYDVALDFILMDAFDDLDNPPASVTAVAQNRWLSDSFKETALNTAIWSVLKAKRKLLRYPNGFIAHFYQLSEHISPVLAWGFLGPENSLTPLCVFFKDLVVNFIQDIFNFERVHYTTLEELADDILLCAQQAQRRAEAFLT